MIIIRQIGKDDLDIVGSLWGNESVREFLGGVADEIRINSAFDAMLKNSNLDCYYYVVEYENEKVGVISVDDYHEPGMKELSYQFVPEWWGRGIAQQSLLMFIEFIAKKKRITCLYAETQEKNLRSRKLLERIGMKKIKSVERYGKPQAVYKLEIMNE